MNKWLWLWLIFVAGWYLIPWWNKVYFLWDDIELLMRFRHPTVETFLASHQYQFFPVFKLFYWLQVQLFGVNPAAFLSVSVGLHLINIYLVYLLINRLTKNNFLSFLSAVLVSFNKSYFTVIFWPTIQSNLLLTTFMLASFHFFCNLKNRFRKTTLLLLASSILLGGLSFGFGVGAGFVFAIIAWLFWKKSRSRAATVATGAIAGIVSILLVILFSSSEIQKDQIWQFSPIRIFNIIYFTLVGVSQAVISRFFLPGFVPSIHSPANIAIMIILPATILFFFLRTIFVNRKQPSILSPLFLFISFTVIPYFIAALARSGPGALGGLAERYIYLPFFAFILALTYSLHLNGLKQIPSHRRLYPILIGAAALISLGHQITMYLEVNKLFL